MAREIAGICASFIATHASARAAGDHVMCPTCRGCGRPLISRFSARSITSWLRHARPDKERRTCVRWPRSGTAGVCSFRHPKRVHAHPVAMESAPNAGVLAAEHQAQNASVFRSGGEGSSRCEGQNAGLNVHIVFVVSVGRTVESGSEALRSFPNVNGWSANKVLRTGRSQLSATIQVGGRAPAQSDHQGSAFTWPAQAVPCLELRARGAVGKRISFTARRKRKSTLLALLGGCHAAEGHDRGARRELNGCQPTARPLSVRSRRFIVSDFQPVPYLRHRQRDAGEVFPRVGARRRGFRSFRARRACAAVHIDTSRSFCRGA